MDNTRTELAQRIRARAFRSRNIHAAQRLLALAGEVETMAFSRPPQALLAILRREDAEKLWPKLDTTPATPANDNHPGALLRTID